MKGLSDFFRIIEVPLYLLVIAGYQFAFGNVEKVALMINFMSVLCSALTVLLLFLTINRIISKCAGNSSRWITLIGASVGSLTYTFSDSFWFSAVEGEVYAMSSLFTALVFWAIIRWENASEKTQKANRLLIFIA